MAIDATNTYAEHTRVEARIGDLLIGNIFSTETTPTLAQCEIILDNVAAEINVALLNNGYVAPLSSSDDAIVYTAIRAANVAGACVQVLTQFPGEALDPDFPDPQKNRISGLQAEYNRMIELINEGKLKATRLTKLTAQFIVGSARDRETGDLKNPLFDRNQDGYPGRLPLTDSSQ